MLTRVLCVDIKYSNHLSTVELYSRFIFQDLLLRQWHLIGSCFFFRSSAEPELISIHSAPELSVSPPDTSTT